MVAVAASSQREVWFIPARVVKNGHVLMTGMVYPARVVKRELEWLVEKTHGKVVQKQNVIHSVSDDWAS